MYTHYNEVMFYTHLLLYQFSATYLIDGGQISVHVARETTATRYLLTGSRHLTQSFSVRAHVGEDYQDVLLTLVSKELGRGKGQSRRDDTLDAVCVHARGCVHVWVCVISQMLHKKQMPLDKCCIQVNPFILQVRGYVHVSEWGGGGDGGSKAT